MSAAERAAERRKKILARGNERLSYITNGTPLSPLPEPPGPCSQTQSDPQHSVVATATVTPPTPAKNQSWSYFVVGLLVTCSTFRLFDISWILCAYIILRTFTLARSKPMTAEQLQRSLVVVMLLPPQCVPAFQLLLRYSSLFLDVAVFLATFAMCSLIRILAS